MANQQRFFQMRQMTKPMDNSFEDEMIEIKELTYSLRREPVNFQDERLKYDQEILADWEAYREGQIKKIIHETVNSSNPDYKICLCEFANNRSISMEIWIKIAYDVFYDELDGNNLRMKFWNDFRRRCWGLRDQLMIKEWPGEWKYIEYEPCLTLDIIKLYEQYLPIRKLLAQNLNELASNYMHVDIRRMPFLVEDRGCEIECTRRTWFPNLTLLSGEQLERIYYSNTVFTHQILRFIVTVKKIVMPIFQFFDERGEAGSVVNIYGTQHEFMFELLQSLKGLSGLAIRTADATLRVQKSFKQGSADSRTKEDICKVIIATLSQHDVNEEMLKDIYDNIQFGYTTFQSDVYAFNKPYPKLILMVSERKLSFKMPRADDIQYHQIPDILIEQLLRQIDYQFLIYYVNLLFNKVMTVQQRSCQRKPFFQLFMLMWAYALPEYLRTKNPRLVDSDIFKILEEYEVLIEQENIRVDLDQDTFSSQSESSEPIEEIFFKENVEVITLGSAVKKIKFN